MKEFIEKQKGDLKVFAKKLEEKAKSHTNEVDNTYKHTVLLVSKTPMCVLHTHVLLGNQKADISVFVEKAKSSAELSINLLKKGSQGNYFKSK